MLNESGERTGKQSVQIRKGEFVMKHRSWIACLLTLVLMLSVFPLCMAETDDDPELAEGADLRIMSYNILHPDWSRVPVKGRDEIVAGILQYYMPDVVALQEAGAKWHKALTPLLVEPGVFAVHSCLPRTRRVS